MSKETSLLILSYIKQLLISTVESLQATIGKSFKIGQILASKVVLLEMISYILQSIILSSHFLPSLPISISKQYTKTCWSMRTVLFNHSPLLSSPYISFHLSSSLNFKTKNQNLLDEILSSMYSSIHFIPSHINQSMFSQLLYCQSTIDCVWVVISSHLLRLLLSRILQFESMSECS